jgi:hypothetical protein
MEIIIILVAESTPQEVVSDLPKSMITLMRVKNVRKSHYSYMQSHRKNVTCTNKKSMKRNTDEKKYGKETHMSLLIIQ